MTVIQGPWTLPEPGDDLAERLVAALCDGMPVADWRAAALAAANDPRASLAAAALEQALRSADAVRLWDLCDDLETALFRLDTDRARGIVRGRHERDCIRAATLRAVGALLCRRGLSASDRETLVGPFLRAAAGSASSPGRSEAS